MWRPVLLLCLSTFPLLSAFECRTGWFRFHDSCYKFERMEKASHRKASERCNDIGASLFVANSREEFKFVMQEQAPQNTWTWLGLQKLDEDLEGQWQEFTDMDYRSLPWLVMPYGNAVNGWTSVSKCAAYWNPSSEVGKYVYWYPCSYEFHFVCERYGGHRGK